MYAMETIAMSFILVKIPCLLLAIRSYLLTSRKKKRTKKGDTERAESTSTFEIPFLASPSTNLGLRQSAPFAVLTKLIMDPHLRSPPPHVSVAEVYTAAHAANPTAGHPPYVEMISSAITALNERNGSSKKAVEKYISGAYSNLPPHHSDLLTYHLHQLKQSGYLRTVKKSYKLAHRPRILSPVAAFTPSPTTGSSRKRGRPPKSTPLTLFQSNDEPQSNSHVHAVSDLPHFSLKPAELSSPTSKKRPGRPPKKASVSPAVLNGATSENGPSAAYSSKDLHLIQSNSHVHAISDLPHFSLKPAEVPSPTSKKRPGRPPKKASVSPAVLNGATAENGPSAAYSPKDLHLIQSDSHVQVISQPTRSSPKFGEMQSPTSKKRPGRPQKKITSPAAPTRATPENGPSAIYSPGDLLNSSGGTAKRKAGRPPKLTPRLPRAQQSGSTVTNKAPGVVDPDEAHLPAPESAPTDNGRPRGRPKKLVKYASVRVGKTLYMRSGRQVGRPRKDVPITRHRQSDRGESASLEEFKTKVACLQGRIGQAVGVLKQHLTAPNIAGAATALQDLERISKADVANTPIQQIKAPLR